MSVEQHYGCMSAQQNGFVTFAETKVNKFHILKPKLSVYQLSIIKVLYLYIKSHMHIFSFYTFISGSLLLKDQK